jgi:hypothetical protein
LKDWTVDEAVKSRLYGEAERWWLNDVLTLSSKVPMMAAEGFVAKDEVQQAYYRALLKLFDGSLKPTQAYDTLNDSIPKLINAAKSD